jgi:hypothetical protein
LTGDNTWQKLPAARIGAQAPMRAAGVRWLQPLPVRLWCGTLVLATDSFWGALR